MTDDLLDELWRLARKASFHYADDSCKEWDQASSDKHAALRIFDENPDLQEGIRAEFRELWSLDRERPTS